MWNPGSDNALKARTVTDGTIERPSHRAPCEIAVCAPGIVAAVQRYAATAARRREGADAVELVIRLAHDSSFAPISPRSVTFVACSRGVLPLRPRRAIYPTSAV